MISKKRLMVGVLCLTVTLMWCGAVSGAADSVVPDVWNVAPMRDGAYLEAFDGVLPSWAGLVGLNALVADFPTMDGSDLPTRSNLWFDANSKVMQLATDGGVVTNSLAYSDENPVTFGEKAVFVDARIRFDAMSEEIGGDLTADAKIAVFLNADCRLVVFHGNGVTTNETVRDTNKWHQLTMKLNAGKCDVLLNDTLVFSGLTLNDNGDTDTLHGVNFYGTGYVDELFVSHGDPAYAVAGPTAAIPDLPADGDNPPTDEQQTLINVWVQGKDTITSLSMTQDQLSHAYLLDAVTVSDGEATPATCEFGILGLDPLSATSIKVTVSLKTGGVGKDGGINGKIQLQGKVNYGDAWQTLADAITPTTADFDAGSATYVFTIPDGGYKFFRPLIVP